MYLIIDTETTGLTRLAFANPENCTSWPRMVQVAWALAHDNGEHVEYMSHIIRPVGFEIPPTAVRIHGITSQYAQEHGKPIKEILKELNRSMAKAHTLIGHNLNFDIGVIQSEVYRLNATIELPTQRVCTLHAGIRFLKERKGRKNPGRPTLSLLYENLFGFDFYPKHDAGADVKACSHSFFRLQKLNFID